MSVSSIQRQIEAVQRDIQSLQNQLSSEAAKEAQKSSRIASIGRSISSSSSLSTIKSKQREAQRLENEIVNIQKKKADIQKKIAKKTAQLHGHQQSLMKEQSREQERFKDSLNRTYSEQFTLPNAALSGISRSIAPTVITAAEPEHDAFISHACEDKEELVRPLAKALQLAGHNIWYDEFALTIGDSLRKSIDKGLSNSRFGIVVFSPDFFAKQWTEYELNGLVAKEMAGGKVILPLWHKVSKDQVLQFSPTFADKLALNTAMFTISELASKLSNVINGV
jgi:hypothetical protein